MIDRHAHNLVRERIQAYPAVALVGPRQSGKTTLARHYGEEKGYRYYSFDDEAVRSTADDDPAGFVAGLPDRVILDEVQLVPRLFSAVKLAVDRDHEPGRFIMTGSANVLLIPRISE